MRQIPQRELRNDIGRVLRAVEQGERIRVTVGGRPVADLVPIGDARRTFVPREALLRLLERAALDDQFAPDVDAATGATIDEL
jgi:prevent-host-death family protein